MVELCAKILQIMCTRFKDYAQSFYQLCVHYVSFSWVCATYFSHLKIKSWLDKFA